MQFWRLFALCTLMLPSIGLGAKVNPILYCLGQEEAKLHLSRTLGPVYQLNQKLINRLLLVNKASVKMPYLKEICHHPTYSPSLMLLNKMIFEGLKIFSYNPDTRATSDAPYEKKILLETIDMAPDYFLQFLSDLQGHLPLAQCLEQTIPEVKKLFERYKYLQGEISDKQLFHLPYVKKIFSRLKNLTVIYQQCEKMAQKKRKKMKVEDPVGKRTQSPADQ